MLEKLHRRAQLFEVTMGGELRVEGRLDAVSIKSARKERKEPGIGTDDEDLGDAPENGDRVLELPPCMVGRLRVDPPVWWRKPG